MAVFVRRREFVATLCGAAAWPLVVNAQQSDKIYRLGYLGVAPATAQAALMKALREGGYNQRQVAELAAQLVGLKPDVIVTVGPGALAVKDATTTIPIVIAQTGDAVASGLVASLDRPGGNVTGMTFFGPELAAKRLELLKEMLPDLVQAGVLINPENPLGGRYLAAMRLAAQSLRLELSEFAVREATDLEGAFAAMAAKPISAFVTLEDPTQIYNAEASAKLASTYRLAGCGFVGFAQAGGLVGYGVNFPDMWQRAAIFVDKIFHGAKPAALPVEQATKFLTVVNLRAAKAIGIEVPTSLLLRADEVIE
jgi:ABC-type uncharacterized transport system substrate-binding protein